MVCAGCGGDYSPTNLPNLLECGHLICKQCIEENLYNICVTCKIAIKIKKKNFDKIVKITHQHQKADRIFKFMIFSKLGKNGELFDKVSGDTKVKDLIGMCE